MSAEEGRAQPSTPWNARTNEDQQAPVTADRCATPSDGPGTRAALSRRVQCFAVLRARAAPELRLRLRPPSSLRRRRSRRPGVNRAKARFNITGPCMSVPRSQVTCSRAARPAVRCASLTHAVHARSVMSCAPVRRARAACSTLRASTASQRGHGFAVTAGQGQRGLRRRAPRHASPPLWCSTTTFSPRSHHQTSRQAG